MLRKKNFSLLKHNTFGIDVQCSDYYEVNSREELQQLVNQGVFLKKFLLLGGGSNMLFTQNFEGTVVHLNIVGIEFIEQIDQQVIVRAQAGENWHQFVLFCIEKQWAGLENLSLIPGNVGTAPIQNIGAYGVEVKDCIDRVWYMDLESGEYQSLLASECAFEYRNSIFKGILKDKVAVLAVDFKLHVKPQINTSYGAIKDELTAMGIDNPGIKEVSQAVIHIRKSKLPDPEILGNCGSFFKNPVVSQDIADALLNKYPQMPFYPLPQNQVKIPAGWLIEHAGWKGKKVDKVGMHERQALVLVNYGGATGAELWQHAQRVQDSVFELFGVQLEAEVNII